jgi:hypothetical protein
VSVESDLIDPPVCTYAQLKMDLISTEGIVQVTDTIRAFKAPSVWGRIVMIEDFLTIQRVVHSGSPSLRRLLATSLRESGLISGVRVS